MKSKKKILTHKARLNIIKITMAAVIILLFVLPTNASLPKVDMEALTTVIGIDKTETGLKCTTEIILPAEGSGTKGESVVISGEGKTLSTVFENLNISIGRKLELHHCALIIIGKEKAEDGILEELEFLLSAGKVSPGIRLILSGNKDAGEFVEKLSEYTKKMDTDNLIKYLGYGAHNYSQELVLFLSETYSRSNASVMPCIEFGDKAENMKAIEGDKAIKSSENDEEKEDDKKQGEGNQEESSNNGEGGSGGGDEKADDQGGEKKPTLIQRAEKIGIFANGKLKTVWEGRVTNGLAWADPETKYGVVLLEDFKIKDKLINNLSCFLIKKKIKMKADFNGETPVLKINVNAKFKYEERNKLYEIMESTEDISKEINRVITDELEKHISNDILPVLENSKKDGCDALFLHDTFYRYERKKYEKFISEGRDLLAECAVEFKFDIKLN